MAQAQTQIDQASTLYRNSYHSIGGVDIKAVFFGVTFGNLQAISYSITREKAPIYTCGSPEPRGFARGKRGIAGSLVMVMFDDHALLGAVENLANSDKGDIYKFVSDKDELRPAISQQTNNTTNTTNSQALGAATGSNPLFPSTTNISPINIESFTGTTLEENFSRETPWYVDQIPSFNIVLTGVNEDGYAASMSILGVEIMNEGYGISIDDLISEQQMTYVCRAVSRWRKITSESLLGIQKQQ